jgi:predicted lipoprotein with Yx(FWY)xxD motif
MGSKLRTPGSIRTRGSAIGAVVAVCAFVLLTGIAAATLSSLGVAKQTVAGKSENIVVDRSGTTVYELGGESLAHLQCTTHTCIKLFPPVTVRSAAARPPKSAGVPGTLSILHRVRGGFYQVMLNRHPLYYYSLDAHKKGSTRGQGINRFGGGWHVVKAS